LTLTGANGPPPSPVSLPEAFWARAETPSYWPGPASAGPHFRPRCRRPRCSLKPAAGPFSSTNVWTRAFSYVDRPQKSGSTFNPLPCRPWFSSSSPGRHAVVLDPQAGPHQHEGEQAPRPQPRRFGRGVLGFLIGTPPLVGCPWTATVCLGGAKPPRAPPFRLLEGAPADAPPQRSAAVRSLQSSSARHPGDRRGGGLGARVWTWGGGAGAPLPWLGERRRSRPRPRSAALWAAVERRPEKRDLLRADVEARAVRAPSRLLETGDEACRRNSFGRS